MSNDYYVAAAYLRLMLQGDPVAAQIAAQVLGADLSEAAEQEYVTGKVLNQLYQAFAERGLQSWVTEYGSMLGVGSHGPLSFAALSAPNLATALQTLADFMVIRTSAFSCHIEQKNNRLVVILQDRTQHPVAGRWLIESGLLVIQNLVETIVAHPLGDNAIFSFSSPAATNRAELDALYKAKCVYRAAQNSLSIPASWITIPSPLSDPDAFRSNIAKCREIRLNLDKDNSDVLKRVQTRLLNHFDRRLSNQASSSKIPSLNSLATELYMSPRTLIRKLKKQSSSYKKILEQVRIEQSQQLLKQTHFTAAEIADKLGYHDAANFSRAFKRWTRKTPAAWRRSN